MKHTHTAAHHGGFTKLVSKSHAWVEIVVIADVGLVFKPDTEGQIELVAGSEIVLHESGKFRLIHVDSGIAGILCELAWSSGQIVGQAREGPRADEVIL